MGQFFEELKRRNVFRVGIAYLVAAWLLIQVVETIFPAFGFGDAGVRTVVIVLAIGFPLVLIFSWLYELTPEGLKLERDVDRSVSIVHHTGKKLDRAIIVVLTLALGSFAFDKFVLEPERAAEDGVDGWSVTRSTVPQMNEISRTLDEGLRLGALGVGPTVGYAQKGITTYEMFEIQRAAARYGRLTAVHQRFHPSAATPTEQQTGANEIIANAMVLKAPLEMHHDNDYGWWENQEKMALAREQGYNIWATYYPWIAGSGNYGASIVAPDTWEKLMGYKYEETIYDPQLDKYVTKEEFLEFKANEPGRTLVAFSPPREQWLPHWTKVEHFTVAGDGMPGLDIEGNRLTWDSPYEDYAGHPRSAGTHAATLRIARENDVPLMQSISQLSYWGAKHIGDTRVKAMQERGRMQEGMIADVTIFDLENVTEHATFKNGTSGLPSTGIPYVLVNGVIVVRESTVEKDAHPGQSIRFPIEEKGRFEPVGSDVWSGAYEIPSTESE